jgi:hypothetical protein
MLGAAVGGCSSLEFGGGGARYAHSTPHQRHSTAIAATVNRAPTLDSKGPPLNCDLAMIDPVNFSACRP